MIRWLTLPVVAALFLVAPGCKDREQKVAEETEVHEGLFGGTKVEKKQVIKKDGKYEVREKETHLDDEGNVVKQESEVKSPKEGTGVDVRAGKHGVDVDVNVKDRDKD